MTVQGLQDIAFEDFTPGIWDDWNASARSTVAPHGAAQLTNTYGCIPSPGGGLMAGPKKVNTLLETLIESDSGSNYPTNDARMHITSFRVASPVWDRTSSGGVGEVGKTNQPFPDMIAVGYEWYRKVTTNYAHKQRIRLYKMFTQSAANPAQGAVTTYDPITNATVTEYTTNFVHGYTGLDLSRSKSDSPTSPGVGVIAAMAMSNKDVTKYGRVIFPDDQAQTTDSTRAMAGLDGPGGFAAYSLFAHQDRIVALDRSVNYGFGANAELPTDMFIATSVNDVSTTGVSLEAFVSENPGLIGAWASVNASEAFMVKQRGGGFAIRGDIAYPTIVRIPGLEPTYDAVNIPCISQDGMVIYGSRNGVFGWNGSESSIHLSQALSGWFWKVAAGANGKDGVDTYTHVKGGFGRFRNWIATPNNFLFDSNTKGWWRLNDVIGGAKPYIFWDTSAAGYLIGCCAYADAASQTVADWWDFQQGQTSYSWQSQPMKATRARIVEFREITLVAQGAGTVTVTLTGLDGATDSVTFTLTATTEPEAQTLPIGMHGSDVVMKIVSASGSTTAAPRIHRITPRYRERATARAASS